MSLDNIHDRYNYTLPVNYYEYIYSDKWREITNYLKRKYDYTCQHCKERHILDRRNLHTHHKHYRTLGYEAEEDLIILCAKCHDMEHKRQREAEISTIEALKRITEEKNKFWNSYGGLCEQFSQFVGSVLTLEAIEKRYNHNGAISQSLEAGVRKRMNCDAREDTLNMFSGLLLTAKYLFAVEKRFDTLLTYNHIKLSDLPTIQSLFNESKNLLNNLNDKVDDLKLVSTHKNVNRYKILELIYKEKRKISINAIKDECRNLLLGQKPVILFGDSSLRFPLRVLLRVTPKFQGNDKETNMRKKIIKRMDQLREIAKAAGEPTGDLDILRFKKKD